MQQPDFSTVSVVGLGYIGLPTAAIFASRKLRVIGVDVNQHTVDTINRGKIHIVEPELDMLVHAAVIEGYLRATTQPEPAETFLVAVPTPFKGDHEPDLRYIKAAAESIAPVLTKGNIVILESTSPVGTTKQMAKWLAVARPDLRFPVEGESASEIDVCIAYCPERVLPGQIVRELVENDRIIGGLTEACARRAETVYRVFVQGNLLVTNARTAEMCKLTENAFRDVNIAFANELSIICDKLGINVWELIRLANHHPRVNILQPGCGVGGHCIAVDPWFLVSQDRGQTRLIQTARQVNDNKPDLVAEKIMSLARSRGISQIACLGAAFKPDIDDLRESPALKIVQKLIQNRYMIKLVEPNIRVLPPVLETTTCQLVSLDSVLDNASNSVIAVLVAHKEFKSSPALFENKPLDFCGALTGRTWNDCN